MNLTIEVVARGEMTTRSDNKKKRDIKEIKPPKKSEVPEYSSWSMVRYEVRLPKVNHR